MCQFNAFGVSGGPRGVNQGQGVFRFDLLGPFPKEVAGIFAVAAVDDFIEGQDNLGRLSLNLDQGLQVGALVLDFEEFGHLLGILCDGDFGAGILGLEGYLLGGQGSVDRDVDGGVDDRRQVNHVPLGPVVQQHHQAVTAFQAQLLESHREERRAFEELLCRKDTLATGKKMEIVFFSRLFGFEAVDIEDVLDGHPAAPSWNSHGTIP